MWFCRKLDFYKYGALNILYLVGMPFKLSKYAKIEIIFFLTYCYLFRMITDFEFNYWEKNLIGIDIKSVEYNLVFGTENLLKLFVFYKVLRYCLATDKLLYFVGFILLFLVGYHYYAKVFDLLIANLPFLSDSIKADALRYYDRKSLGFSLTYMFMEFLSIGALAYFMHSKQQNKQLKVLKEQQLISELAYLKAQLQPHFFFNTLNNIYSLALKQSKDTAPLVAKLAEMMRYMLYKADEKFVSLHEEITFIRNYVEVEKIRYRDTLTINFDEQGIDKNSNIGPLLLLPFIENAFKHGIEQETGSGFVNIVVCQVNRELTLEVTNSIASNELSRKGGIGLQNVKKRLLLLYPDHILNIKHDEKNYNVNLTLLLK